MSTPAAQAALKEAILERIMSADKGLYILPYFLGLWMDSLLMGIFLAQLVTYWRFIKKDKKHIVATVGIVAVLATAATIIVLVWTLHLYVWGFGTYSNFSEMRWLVRYASVEIATIAVVQAFYIDRACRLYRHWWPAALMAPFVVVTVVMGGVALNFLGLQYEAASLEVKGDLRPQITAYTWLGLILATDTLITVTIAWGLYRIKTGWSTTDTKIRRVLVRSFETQAPALLCSAVSLITWSRRFEVVLAILMVQSKVFSLGLLITLNLRAGSSVTSDATISYPAASTPHNRSRLPSYPLDNMADESVHAKSDHRESPDYAWETPSHGQGALNPHLGNSVEYPGLEQHEWASTTGLNRKLTA